MSTADVIAPVEAILGAAGTGPQHALHLRTYTNWPKFVYLIHFTEKRHHAGHYLGCSYALFERLAAHANGRAARLTKALWEDAQDWQLAALFLPKPHTARSIFELEKMAKARHSSADYCPICKPGGLHVAPPAMIEYPLPVPVSAHELRKAKE